MYFPISPKSKCFLFSLFSFLFVYSSIALATTDITLYLVLAQACYEDLISPKIFSFYSV